MNRAAATRRSALQSAILRCRSQSNRPLERAPTAFDRPLERAPTDARGFTLIELLVALTIFAVLGFTVSTRIGDVVSQTFSLERRTVAHWVAENHVNRMRLPTLGEPMPLPTGRSRERLVMAGREWIVETEVQETESPLLRRVEVRVLELTEGGDEVGPLDTVTAFLGVH
jgi:general secretion pathway protein I